MDLAFVFEACDEDGDGVAISATERHSVAQVLDRIATQAAELSELFYDHTRAQYSLDSVSESAAIVAAIDVIEKQRRLEGRKLDDDLRKLRKRLRDQML